MLRELYPHMSTREVARRIGRPLGATRSRAKALGLRKSAEYRASGAIRPEREYCYTPEQMLAWLTEHVRLDGECRIWAGRRAEEAERRAAKAEEKARLLQEILQGRAAA